VAQAEEVAEDGWGHLAGQVEQGCGTVAAGLDAEALEPVGNGGG
jgi:hypothetical protein